MSEKTIYRDKRGRKIDPSVERAERAAAERREEERKEKDMEWGRGLVQKKMESDERKRHREEKHAPLAR